MTTPNAPKMLVSAWLLGRRVRYDGGSCEEGMEPLRALAGRGRVLAACPEMLGGLPSPRVPAEIEPGYTAEDVLAGSARVLTAGGVDVTEAFLQGAHAALGLARRHDVRVAVLKQKNPSCGADAVYDGLFSGQIQAGMGVTAALLRAHGVCVFGEDRLHEAILAMEQIA